jgi:hypothetical protein
VQATPETSLSRHQYYRWRSPGLGVAVYFRKKVMEWLSARACATVHLPRHRGEMASGVLLGGRLVDGTLVVESAEPLQQNANLDEQIRRLRAEGAVILGTYRVDSTADLQGGHQDVEFVEERLGGGLCLALAAESQGGPLRAAACLTRTGHGISWSKLEPFPFGSAGPAVSTGWGDTARFPAWVPVSLASLVLGAAVFWWFANPPSGSAAPPGVELSAEQSGGQWALKWNPHSPALAEASSAYVVIGDGNAKSRYALTPEQLQTGSVHYTPSHAHVAFTMELVNKSGRSSRETLIVVHHPQKQDSPKRGPTRRRPPV